MNSHNVWQSIDTLFGGLQWTLNIILHSPLNWIDQEPEVTEEVLVEEEDFEMALASLVPSLSVDELNRYKNLERHLQEKNKGHRWRFSIDDDDDGDDDDDDEGEEWLPDWL